VIYIKRMNAIAKKIVVDDSGTPQEVIISWDNYQHLAEVMGWDLDDEAQEQLRAARREREAGNLEAFVSLDDI